MKLGNLEFKYGLSLAPMAGYTDRAMRYICNKLGCEYSVTEMISAKAVTFGDMKTFSLARILPDEGPDKITRSMKSAIDETNRRRRVQMEYNEENGIVPKTIIKGVHDIIDLGKKSDEKKKAKLSKADKESLIEEAIGGISLLHFP